MVMPSSSLCCCAILLLLVAIFASQAVSLRTLRDEEDALLSIRDRHAQWMNKYGHTYKDPTEKERRFQVFKANVEFIDTFNLQHNGTYVLGVNAFAHLTNEEFLASHSGLKKAITSDNKPVSSFRYENVANIPPTMDWRNEGAVTPVKYQGQCGCCWAFSAVAAMEGVTQLLTGNLISLSEQQLVDCVYQHNGCGGGSMDDAFNFIQQNEGLATEADYPYIGVDATCNNQKPAAAKISGHEDVPSNDETALLKAVANQPVSVGIDAGSRAFQFYSGGVFNGDCGTKLNHAVTVVGYGTDSNGTEYWLVKNSWGTQWGEDGYMRLERNVMAEQGLCGIAMWASYPIA